MKKIVVLGAGGMAGHVMAESLAQKPDYGIIRCDLNAVTPDTIVFDVTDWPRLEYVLRGRRPDVVINCVGLLVKAAQDRVDRAILINSFLPHFLSRLGRACGFKLIHISTDCVFSGDRGGYTEGDFRDGDTPYARTKALGEVINDVDLTLRTSIIGPELILGGTGLLHWFLMQKGTIKGYSKSFWSGVTTLELAKVVDQCICHGVSGLVNLAMSGKISKYDLLIACQKIWDHGQVRILPDDSHASDKSLVSRRTDLPFHLPPSYPVLLAELRDFMNQHCDQYRHYEGQPKSTL
jgi:dTDP-4-dehydrorhamnose reductase